MATSAREDLAPARAWTTHRSAEDWLEPVTGPLPIPWIYDPLHGSRLLKHLNRLELLARGLLARRG
ncbi:MAG: hypothetical protein U5K43_03140 [Halofilum sp. (in: g-proteobacteria)]|nr:hypothetical protein [Halofilum sp. (in: g-proteobacteria)]